MATVILFNKPFEVLSQFSDDAGRRTLAEFIDAPGFYPAGRLDYDSEGLLVLTDDGALQARIASPRYKAWKRYWVQVEGEIDDAALLKLRRGVSLRDGQTRPARATQLPAPTLWERHPPIRERANKPVSWLELAIQEGRNRQVRRMTAAVGFPTLRLIRRAVDSWELDGLEPGEMRRVEIHLPRQKGRRRQHR